MEEGPADTKLDFIPAVCFVARGVAKEKPERIGLTRSELARLLKSTKEDLANENMEEDDSESEEDDQEMDVEQEEGAAEGTNEHPGSDDEFGFGRYDSEDNPNPRVADISNIVDPDDHLPDEEDDSEEEDDLIKPTDNLILVGHVQDDCTTVEVWIFNEVEECLYTHHYFVLSSPPLCIEWLNRDPGYNKPGNLCAVGTMKPVIEVWDLDLQDTIEPIYCLGSKGNRRKNKPAFGHKDAVLDLSWNRHYEHIIASGSVDKTLILWDIDQAKPHTTITAFKEKVHSIAFHPDEANSILAGSADGSVRLFDCRDAEQANSSYVKWKTPGEVEKVLWNPSDTNYFAIGSNEGSLHYADKRQPKKLLWSYKAHEEEISGICFNSQIKNLLSTTSTEGYLKIWDFNSAGIKPVYSHDFKLGRLQCMTQCPENPFVLAVGGEKTPKCRVYNIKNFEPVRRVFNIPDAEQE